MDRYLLQLVAESETNGKLLSKFKKRSQTCTAPTPAETTCIADELLGSVPSSDAIGMPIGVLSSDPNPLSPEGKTPAVTVAEGS